MAEWFKAPVLKFSGGRPYPFCSFTESPILSALLAFSSVRHPFPSQAFPSSSVANWVATYDECSFLQNHANGAYASLELHSIRAGSSRPDSVLMQFWICVAFPLREINAMQQALRRFTLMPAGFVVESAFYEADKAVFTVRPSSSFGLCPLCGTVSGWVHSHYGAVSPTFRCRGVSFSLHCWSNSPMRNRQELKINLES